MASYRPGSARTFFLNFIIRKMKSIFSILILSVFLCSSCSKKNEEVNLAAAGKTTLSIDAVFANQDFALNKDFISNGKTYNFTKFRYWLSNLTLITSAGVEYKVPGAYYLMEETGEINLESMNGNVKTVYPATKREDIVLTDVPAGDYKTIRFSVGVDQKYNDNLSLRSGELSQFNGMTNVSWMWLTSYIFSSVAGKVSEGTGAQLSAKSILVETGLNANLKTVSLTLPGVWHISAGNASKVVLKADVSKITEGIDLMNDPLIGASKPDVMAKVAGIYAEKVFSVQSVN